MKTSIAAITVRKPFRAVIAVIIANNLTSLIAWLTNFDLYFLHAIWKFA
jgi:hypothetical protein